MHGQQEPDCTSLEIQKDLKKHGYEYIREIGRGGYGTVFLVRSLKYRTEFAAKRCEIKPPPGKPPPPAGSLELQEADTREIEALISLDCPNIISFYDYFVENDALFLILEYCQGGTISDLVVSKGHIETQRLQVFCLQIATALQACHERGIAHRDIKPANIFIDAFDRPKLADFGISMKFQNGSKTNQFGGTLQYMSPEMITDNEYDPYAADIWALGVLFYIVATGKYPFSFITRDDLEKAILSGHFNRLGEMDPCFVSLLEGMFIVDPSQRFRIQQVTDHTFFKEIPKAQKARPTPSYTAVHSHLGRRVYSVTRLVGVNPRQRRPSLSHSTTFIMTDD